MGSGLVRLSVNGAAPCKGTQLFSHDCLEQKLITKLHVKKARTNVFNVEGIWGNFHKSFFFSSNIKPWIVSYIHVKSSKKKIWGKKICLGLAGLMFKHATLFCPCHH